MLSGRLDPHPLATYINEEFAELTAEYDDNTCPPCMDVSGVALLRPSLIQRYTYGSWQGTLEIQECLDGIFKLIRLDPSISLIQPLEAGQFLALGEAPTSWTRSRHFPEEGSSPQLTIPIACAP